MAFIIDDVILMLMNVFNALILLIEFLRLAFILMIAIIPALIARRLLGKDWFANVIALSIGFVIFLILYLTPILSWIFVGFAGIGLVVLYLVGIPILAVFAIILGALR